MSIRAEMTYPYSDIEEIDQYTLYRVEKGGSTVRLCEYHLGDVRGVMTGWWGAYSGQPKMRYPPGLTKITVYSHD